MNKTIPVTAIVVIGAVVVAITLLTTPSLPNTTQVIASQNSNVQSPMHVLKTNFVNGKITEEEFERKKKLLGHR